MIGQLLGAGVAVGLAVWGLWPKKKVITTKPPKPDEPAPPVEPDMSKVCVTSDAGMSLKTGQQILKSLGYDLGKFGADGSCGPLTKAATTKFQNDVNNDKFSTGGDKLAVTGVIDKRTASALWAFKPLTLVPQYTYVDTKGQPNDQSWIVTNPAENYFRAYVAEPVNPGYISASVDGYSKAEVENRIDLFGSANPYNSTGG